MSEEPAHEADGVKGYADVYPIPASYGFPIFGLWVNGAYVRSYDEFRPAALAANEAVGDPIEKEVTDDYD